MSREIARTQIQVPSSRPRLGPQSESGPSILRRSGRPAAGEPEAMAGRAQAAHGARSPAPILGFAVLLCCPALLSGFAVLLCCPALLSCFAIQFWCSASSLLSDFAILLCCQPEYPALLSGFAVWLCCPALLSCFAVRHGRPGAEPCSAGGVLPPTQH
jgi:hypothetical protein